MAPYVYVEIVYIEAHTVQDKILAVVLFGGLYRNRRNKRISGFHYGNFYSLDHAHSCCVSAKRGTRNFGGFYIDRV